MSFFDFRKKLLIPCGRGQKVEFGLKLDFFKDCFQTAPQNFSIFCMKLDNNKVFQTMYMLSSGKLLLRPSRGEKVKFWVQNWLFQKLSCLDDSAAVAVGPVVHCPLLYVRCSPAVGFACLSSLERLRFQNTVQQPERKFRIFYFECNVIFKYSEGTFNWITEHQLDQASEGGKKRKEWHFFSPSFSHLSLLLGSFECPLIWFIVPPLYCFVMYFCHMYAGLILTIRWQVQKIKMHPFKHLALVDL